MPVAGLGWHQGPRHSTQKMPMFTLLSLPEVPQGEADAAGTSCSREKSGALFALPALPCVRYAPIWVRGEVTQGVGRQYLGHSDIAPPPVSFQPVTALLSWPNMDLFAHQ